MARQNTESISDCPTPPELPLDDLLWVPSNAPAGDRAPVWLPAATRVRVGDSLVTDSPQGTATPIAPAAGIVGAAGTVRLVGGKAVHAVEFHPDRIVNDATVSDLAVSDLAVSDLAVSDLAVSDLAVAATTAPTAPAGDSPAAQAAARWLGGVSRADLAAWLTRIQVGGVWADRWTCPDLIGQFHEALSRPVDTLICNLLDTDPWLPLARVVAGAWPLEVACGLGLLGRLTGASNWWALTDPADNTAVVLRRAAASVAEKLRIAAVENDYPQLDPSLLVKATTDRRLRPGRLPTSLGVLLIDAPAAAAIGRIVLASAADRNTATGISSATRVPIVVYDQAGDAVYAFTVAPGTSVATVARHIALPSAVREVYAGSPLRQIRVEDGDIIGGGELTLFAAPPQPSTLAVPCVRCGWCIEACPTGCRPAGLLEAAQRQDADLARHHGLDACIECGLCTFVCPSHLPLLAGIRHLRRHMTEGVG